MKSYQLFFGIGLALCLFACSSNDPTETPLIPDPINDVLVPTGDEQYLNLKSDYIFDQKKLHTFELNISEAALKRLDDDPVAEEYEEGSLTFEGETLGIVGIRYKGSIGAYVGCVDGSDWFNPSGKKTCTKLSMKVKINWLDTDDKFYGLKKLQLHAQNLDKSQLRDRLGYHLFREMGVKAPRSTHARLVINGTYIGLFALVEQIDGRFTKEHFEEGDGNLYKEVWPISANGLPQSESVFLSALKTNEDKNPSAKMIQSFGAAIANAPDDSLKAVIKQWMDVSSIISYAVVDRMIRADDGPFHWYCGNGPSSCNNHNYYWYEDETNQKLHLIPWDLDNSFENIVLRNGVTYIPDAWGEVSNDCAPFKGTTFPILQRSAACDRLTYAWTLFNEAFQQKKIEFINGPLSRERIDPLLDEWSTQIEPATQEAANLYGDAVSVNNWKAAVDVLRSSLEIARAN